MELKETDFPVLCVPDFLTSPDRKHTKNIQKTACTPQFLTYAADILHEGPWTKYPVEFFQFLKKYDFWSTYWFFKILSEFLDLYTLLISKVSVDRSKRYRDLKFCIQGLHMINNWALRSFCYILKTTSCFKAKSKMVAQTA